MAYSLFSIYGIEAEYMIVDTNTLKVRPISNLILQELNNGELINEVDIEPIAWSNELVMHVLEIKCSPPATSLKGLDKTFHESIVEINKRLAKHSAVLMPTAMHPWFIPENETVLWPYGQKDIYKAYDRIFSCKGHGWSNLQSVHINLPFANEEEFAKLHAACRFVLPFIPFLAASSPYFEGKQGQLADNRLSFYEKNQARVPSICGGVIPDPIYTLDGYKQMLTSIFNDIKPFDPEGILQHQWLNSRGAIVKFDLEAIEIRVMDIQECPYMDTALVQFVVNFVKYICNRPSVLKKVSAVNSDLLRKIYHEAKGWDDFTISPDFFHILELDTSNEVRKISDFLRDMYKQLKPAIDSEYHKGIEILLNEGNLAKRIVKFAPLKEQTYRKLIECLEKNEVF